MGLSRRRDGFFDLLKEGSSSSAKKKNKNTRQPRVRAQAAQTSPKAAALCPELEVIDEDYDLGKHLDEESCTCTDENESFWLSSDCNSPSSFFSEYRLHDFPQLPRDEWIVSWFHVTRVLRYSLGRSIDFFDGSRINPIEEACLVLEKNLLDTQKLLQDDSREEDVVTWLLSSTENDATDSTSVIFSESSVSSFEDSTGSESPPTPLSIHLKPTSSNLDLDLDLERTGFWVSLLDLGCEDVKWISDSESDLDSLQSSAFPSPSHKTASSSGVTVADKLEESNTDELLFWPFKQKPDWSSGNWDCFSMSPSKNINQKNTALLGPRARKCDRIEVSRRLVFTSETASSSKILGWKQRSSNEEGVRLTSSTPSGSTKPVETLTSESDKPREGKVLNQILLEEDFASSKELSIEKLLGLDEFDGNEGVDFEFNKDDFSLDQSL